jgi:hypothetical protein
MYVRSYAHDIMSLTKIAYNLQIQFGSRWICTYCLKTYFEISKKSGKNNYVYIRTLYVSTKVFGKKNIFKDNININIKTCISLDVKTQTIYIRHLRINQSTTPFKLSF